MNQRAKWPVVSAIRTASDLENGARGRSSVARAAHELRRMAIAESGAATTALILHRAIEASGVRKVFESAEMTAMGQLLQTRDGLFIATRPNLSNEVRNWTLAHELGHILLLDASAATDSMQRELESRCDLFAAELLLPRSEFLAELYRELRSDPIRAIVGCANQFQVTLQAAIVRAAKLRACDDLRVSILLARFVSQHGKIDASVTDRNLGITFRNGSEVPEFCLRLLHSDSDIAAVRRVIKSVEIIDSRGAKVLRSGKFSAERIDGRTTLYAYCP